MTFEQENNQILSSVLENAFFKPFRKDKKTIEEQKLGMEFFFTPDCNQNCSYCYLCKNKEQLYPKDIKDENIILKNFKIVLNYCIKENLHPERFDLFSGDIWDREFGVKVLETLLEAVHNGFSPNLVMIPTNFCFLLSTKYTEKMEYFLSEFSKTKVRLKLSCSNDGYYIDSMTRPLNPVQNSSTDLIKGSQEYYDKLFTFCKKWNMAFHPMVAAHGIEYWKENFEWWITSLEKYEFDPLLFSMFLEVRNDDWTEEKIIHYLKFLNHSCDFLYNHTFKQNFDEYCDWILGITASSRRLRSGHYNSLKAVSYANNTPTCSIAKNLAIRGGDLAIIPCHRLSYNEFIIGHFITENDEIVGVKAKNLQMMNQIWFNTMLGAPKCGTCVYNQYCTRGCYGSQYETNKDFLMPCSTVCNLYKAKLIFLYEKYTKMGIFDSCSHHRIKGLKELIELNKETEEYKKWSKIIETII